MSGGAENAVRWFVRALAAALVLAVAAELNAGAACSRASGRSKSMT
jgi:hypothetical protein